MLWNLPQELLADIGARAGLQKALSIPGARKEAYVGMRNVLLTSPGLLARALINQRPRWALHVALDRYYKGLSIGGRHNNNESLDQKVDEHAVHIILQAYDDTEQAVFARCA